MPTQRKENINSEQNDMNEKKENDKRNIRKNQGSYIGKGKLKLERQYKIEDNKNHKRYKQRADGLRKDKKC